MKIGFYNPYFDSLSGGERYVLTLASHWSKSHNVDMFWDDPAIKEQSEERFHLDLRKVRVVKNVFKNRSILSKMKETKAYDCLFLLSDGSIPVTFSPHTILHFQVPFKRVEFPLWKRMQVEQIVCNSQFTKQHIDQSVGKGAHVIYPPVDTKAFSSGKKEKLIVSIGRFSSFFQAKKQEVLIDAFKLGVNSKKLLGWKLVLAGGLLESDDQYFKELVVKAKGYDIQLLPNISFPMLQELYKKAAFYWHAAGFQETDPTRMEHFGITTVESMAAGCIPIVYGAGGQTEIIKSGENGFLWKTIKDCIEYTSLVIRDNSLGNLLKDGAIESAEDFSIGEFAKKFDTLLLRMDRNP